MSGTSSTDDGFCLINVDAVADTIETISLSGDTVMDVMIEAETEAKTEAKITCEHHPDGCPEDGDDPALPPISSVMDMIADTVEATVRKINETNAASTAFARRTYATSLVGKELQVDAKEHMILFASFFEHLLQLVASLPRCICGGPNTGTTSLLSELFELLEKAVGEHAQQADGLLATAEQAYPVVRDSEKSRSYRTVFQSRALDSQHHEMQKGLAAAREALAETNCAALEARDGTYFFSSRRWSTHLRHMVKLALAAHVPPTPARHHGLEQLTAKLYLDTARAAVASILGVDHRRDAIVASLTQEGVLPAGAEPTDETMAWYRQFLAQSFAGYAKWVVADVLSDEGDGQKDDHRYDQKDNYKQQTAPRLETYPNCYCTCHREHGLTYDERRRACIEFCPGCRPDNQWVLTKYCRTPAHLQYAAPRPQWQYDKDRENEQIDAVLAEYAKFKERMASQYGQ